MITFGFLVVAQTVRAYESAYPMTEVGVCEIKTLPAGVVLRARSEREYFRENNGLFRKLFEAIQRNQVPMTTPVEAGIAWAIQKVRRPGGERAGGFPGAAGIFRQLETGPARCRVGFRPEGRAPVREGSVLLDAAGAEVGRVTSGGFGASVDAPIGMAYVAASSAAPGTHLQTLVRDRPRACVVAPLPFAPHRYFRSPS